MQAVDVQNKQLNNALKHHSYIVANLWTSKWNFSKLKHKNLPLGNKKFNLIQLFFFPNVTQDFVK